MKLKHYLPILAIAAIFTSCSKGDPGDPGPEGPQGPSGVANINTTIYTVTSWIATSATNTWIATSSEADITDNNSDAVEVYWNTSLNAGWLSLPATSIIATGDELGYGYADNSITFTYYGGTTNSNPPSDSYSTIYFKVTVIPPSIQVKYPKINWKNSAEAAQVPEVKAALQSSK